MRFIKILVGVIAVLGLAFFVMSNIHSEVHVERLISAPVSKVWSVWSDPEAMKGWWSPKDFTAPTIKSDLRVGGSFLYSMRSPKGEMFWNSGTYTEVVPMEKIALKMSFSDENGKPLTGKNIPVPGNWPDEVTVITTFNEVDGKTLITIREIGIPMIMKVMAGMGWDQQFDKFEKLVAP